MKTDAENQIDQLKTRLAASQAKCELMREELKDVTKQRDALQSRCCDYAKEIVHIFKTMNHPPYIVSDSDKLHSALEDILGG